MTINDIVKKYLVENGYDGLCTDECGCAIADLMPCGECYRDCVPGYNHPELAAENKADIWITPKKAAKKFCHCEACRICG